MSKFFEFPKIARLNREMVVTEKIDGTNAQVVIGPLCTCADYADIVSGCTDCLPEDKVVATVGELKLYAGSRTRWITPDDDNYGFARWVREHAEELVKLGPGRHFGEWWGQGIQRNYGLREKRFSLFNVSRWNVENVPACCHVVPTLYRGNFSTETVNDAIRLLREGGSVAAPGFMKPEGVVIYHTHGGHLYKVTCEKDELPKSLVGK